MAILRLREKKRQKESTDPFEDDEVNPYAAQMQLFLDVKGCSLAMALQRPNLLILHGFRIVLCPEWQHVATFESFDYLDFDQSTSTTLNLKQHTSTPSGIRSCKQFGKCAGFGT